MFVQVADIKTHCQIDGLEDAPAILFLHSLGTNLNIWDHQAKELSARYRVIRSDLRGHGLTEATPGPYSIAQLANDAACLLSKLEIENAHVVGLSIGGLIAQQLAIERPALVRSLTLCDTALKIGPPEMWHQRAATVRERGCGAILETVIARWIRPAFENAPGAQALRSMLLSTSREGYASAAEAIASADLTADSARLNVPTQVLVGDADVATPLASAMLLRDAIPQATLTVIENAAHIPTAENPQAVTRAIADFLNSGRVKTFQAA